MVILRIKTISLHFVLLFCLLTFILPEVNAQNTELVAKPKHCIKPRGEKICVANIELQWRSDRTDGYCVYKKENRELIQCWEHANSGKAHIEFRSKKAISYIIERKKQRLILSKTSVSVVYSLKKRRRKSEKRRLWHPF